MKDSELIYAFLVSLSVGELSMQQLSALAAPFGMSETNLRSCLSRMNAKGRIEIRKDGRTAHYRLAEKGRRIAANVGRHFTEQDWSGWDGTFWAAAFSAPDPQKRYRLQKKLHAYRFRPLYPGLWIRPFSQAECIPLVFHEQVAESGMDLLRSSFEKQLSPERVSVLYGLREVEAVLNDALKEARESTATAAARSPEAAFVERVQRGDSLVKAMAQDPLLPPALLPDRWPAAELRRAFKEWIGAYSNQSRPFVQGALNINMEAGI
jgi:phenylacetic acid degradation operon negative regulatory protein